MSDGPAPGGLDRASFEALVADLAAPLLGFARSLGADDATAEDLVQETFLRAWRARDGFRGDAAPLTWLRHILHNAAVDRFRRLAREDLVDEVEELWRRDDYTVDGDAVAEAALDRHQLQDALVRLPLTYRSALLLHDVEGWTAAEIASALDIGVPLAKARIRRGRMALVTELARGEERRRAGADAGVGCWSARAQVSDYIDGALDAETRAAVEAHLAGCPTCPPLYAALVGTHDSLGRLRDPDAVVPPALVERLQARLAQNT